MEGNEFLTSFDEFIRGLGARSEHCFAPVSSCCSYYSEGSAADAGYYVFPDFGLCIVPVTMEAASDPEEVAALLSLGAPGEHRILLYEDRWSGPEGNATRSRLASCLGDFRSVFARKCNVTRTDILTASAFLDRCHSYGSTAAKYKYALNDAKSGELIAVATFSGRKKLPSMNHDDSPSSAVSNSAVSSSAVSSRANLPSAPSSSTNLPSAPSSSAYLPSAPDTRIVTSCEWIRYASLPNVRVVGGMGKMLAAFLEDVHPEEVLSYSDNEWSQGDVYSKLGFIKAFETSPQDYYVDKRTWKRISALKVGRDNLYKDSEFPPSDYWHIWNAGSTRWYRQIEH